MIFTERTIRIINGLCEIDHPIILYRGDFNVEVRFTIIDCPYKYTVKDASNVIETTNASYGQLVIKTPNGDPIFSEVTSTNEGAIVFTITGDMIDEAIELGNYDFQIRLFDSEKTSRATICPVVGGIKIEEPIAIEDGSTVVADTNEVNVARTNYAVTTTATALDVFDSQGNYIETTWSDKMLITDARLNKIEDGITGVNQKIASIDTGGGNVGVSYDEVNEELTFVESGIVSGGGLTEAQITALDNMFKVCAYTSQDISTQYEAFKSAFGIGDTPADKTLTSISVEYTGGDVAVGTALTALTGITVTATYSDNSTAVVTDYTLSGTIVEGTNTITVTYQGQTASFVVTGVSQSTTNNILQPFLSYLISTALPPMYVITQSGNDYTFAVNSEYTGTVNFQNGRAISPTPLTSGKTYKLSVSEAVNFVIYVYGISKLPESTNNTTEPGTLIGSWQANTTEYTFTPEADYVGLRLAISSTTNITFKDLILEEV